MLRELQREEFDAFYRIMEDSFPPDEYRPYEEQKALLSRPGYRILAWGTPVQGFMCLWEFEEFLFLEHFALCPEARGSGLGSRLLTGLLTAAQKPLCLEVEPPVEDLARRRVKFYQRNGMYLNSYPYIQPPISQGKQPIPLLLMTSGGFLNQEEFQKVKGQIYARVYQVPGYGGMNS